MYNEFKPKDMSGKLRVGYVGPGASWGGGKGVRSRTHRAEIII